jgi:hypothetical protein
MRTLLRVLGAGAVAGMLAIAISFAGADRAGAASLIADYHFDGDYSSSVGTAPALVPLPPVTPFSTVALNGAQDGVAGWQEGGGFSFVGALPDPASFSTIVTFAMNDAADYRRILAFDALAENSDYGFYGHGGALDFYTGIDHEGAAVLTNGSFADVAFTRGADGGVQGYFNGAQQFTTTDPDGLAIVGSDGLRFFRDNGTEQSSGKVARIRIYSGQLSPEEVTHIEQAGGRPPSAASRYGPKLIIKKGKHGKKIKGIDTGVLAGCPADGAPCHVSAKATAKVKGKSKTLGKLGYSVPEGSSQDVAFKISKRGRKLLAAKGKLPVTVTVTATAPDGETATAGGQRRL